MNKHRLLHAVCASLAFSFVSPSYAAVTHWVNDDDPSGNGHSGTGISCDSPGYATVQSALDATSSGDTVKVCPGVYHENLLVSTANITLKSTEKAQATIIKAASSNIAVRIHAAGVTFDDFMVQPFSDQHAAIQTLRNQTTISNNIIPFSHSGIMTGCTTSHNTITHNVVRTTSTGSGINLDTCEGSTYGSDNNQVHYNIVCGTGFYSIASANMSAGNEIIGNIATRIVSYGLGDVIKNNSAVYYLPTNIANGNNVDSNVCEY